MKTLSLALLSIGFSAMAQFYPPNLVIEDDTAYPSLENADLPTVEAPEMFRLRGDSGKKVFLVEMYLEMGQWANATVFFDRSSEVEEITNISLNLLGIGTISSEFMTILRLSAVIDGVERDVLCFIRADGRVINRAFGYCNKFGIEIGFFDELSLRKVRLHIEGTTIEADLFNDDNLTTITPPESLTLIDPALFQSKK